MKGIGKNSVQFLKRWDGYPYNPGDVAGFDGKTAKFLLENGLATLLGEDSEDPIPEDQEEETSPESLAEAVRRRLQGKDVEDGAPKISVEEMLEKVPGYGEARLRLTNAPVTSTAAVVYQSASSTSSTALTSTEFGIDQDAGMLFSSTGFFWTASFAGDILRQELPPTEFEAYTVTYSAGYSLPTSQSTNTGFRMPLDIRTACLRTFQSWWGDLYGGSTSFKKFRTDDLEIENYAPPVAELLTGYGDLNEGVQEVLDRYKLEW